MKVFTKPVSVKQGQTCSCGERARELKRSRSQNTISSPRVQLKETALCFGPIPSTVAVLQKINGGNYKAEKIRVKTRGAEAERLIGKHGEKVE